MRGNSLYTTPAIDEPYFDLDVTLGLFDGMSCGQEALKRAGITTRIYLASEIEKYPKIITRKNHPLTVQLGDVTKVVADDLPHVNLLMGGSPCQGFSFAGKQLNFDDPRSALFFEFVRLLKECKPDYFLLENVMMKQEYQDIISEHLGVEPVMINSSLVSAQNRKRLYWTNIPGVSLPDDLQIDLVDVLEEDATEPMLSNIYGGFNEKKPRVHTGKSVTIRAASGGGHIPSVTLKQPKDKGILLKDVLEDLPYHEPPQYLNNEWCGRVRGDMVKTPDDKARCLNATMYKGQISSFVKKPTCGRIIGRKINPETGKRDDYNPDLKAEQRLETRLDEKTGTLTTVQKDNVVVDGPTYRKLTPIECERLQTLPDNYSEGVSNTQRYKALGNGWTIDIIAHILQGLKWQN